MSGQDKCPKCGGYVTNSFQWHGQHAGKVKKICLGCGYHWYAKPLDATLENGERR